MPGRMLLLWPFNNVCVFDVLWDADLEGGAEDDELAPGDGGRRKVVIGLTCNFPFLWGLACNWGLYCTVA